MGSGKSTYAINQLINTDGNFGDKKFLCVLPTLKECERYRDSINAEIFSPECWGTKQNHLQHLITSRRNIATTHALITNANETTLELLSQSDYTLIIDECLDVVHKYKKITNSDIQTLFSGKYVTLDENNFLIWNNEKYEEYDGRFNDVRRLCNMKSLMAYKTQSGTLSKILIWNFPVEFFAFFNNSYILTYYWNGSIQKCYFDLHNVEYQHLTLVDNKLNEYNEKLELERRKSIAALINIYEGKLNDIGAKIGRTNPLCKSWYVKHSKIDNGYLIKKLKNNLENYFIHIMDSPSTDNMYTTFETFEKMVKGKRYSKGFVPCNSKGTNSFREKKVLAYTINLFPNKEVLDFFKFNNIDINQDLYSLCELLQWIWRSQIRDGKQINIYIPSERMRFLLKSWMRCQEMDQIYYDKNKVA